MGKKFDRRREDIKLALELGWYHVGHTGSGHLQFAHNATGIKWSCPCTPSEWRTIKNNIAWLRRVTPQPPREEPS